MPVGTSRRRMCRRCECTCQGEWPAGGLTLGRVDSGAKEPGSGHRVVGLRSKGRVSLRTAGKKTPWAGRAPTGARSHFGSRSRPERWPPPLARTRVHRTGAPPSGPTSNRRAAASAAARRYLSPPGDAAHTAEPAWHRRQRRERQSARALLAVAQGRARLAAHHGGGMRPPRGGRRSDAQQGKEVQAYWVCGCGAWSYVHSHPTACRACRRAPPKAWASWLASQAGQAAGAGPPAATAPAAGGRAPAKAAAAPRAAATPRGAGGSAPAGAALGDFVTVGGTKKERRAARRAAAQAAGAAPAAAEETVEARLVGKAAAAAAASAGPPPAPAAAGASTLPTPRPAPTAPADGAGPGQPAASAGAPAAPAPDGAASAEGAAELSSLDALVAYHEAGQREAKAKGLANLEAQHAAELVVLRARRPGLLPPTARLQRARVRLGRAAESSARARERVAAEAALAAADRALDEARAHLANRERQEEADRAELEAARVAAGAPAEPETAEAVEVVDAAAVDGLLAASAAVADLLRRAADVGPEGAEIFRAFEAERLRLVAARCGASAMAVDEPGEPAAAGVAHGTAAGDDAAAATGGPAADGDVAADGVHAGATGATVPGRRAAGEGAARSRSPARRPEAAEDVPVPTE